jgi:hypothetical protein
VKPGTVSVTPPAIDPTAKGPGGVQIARQDSQRFGSPASVSPSAAYALALAPADPVMGATSVLSDGVIGGLSGLRTTSPAGTWTGSSPLASVDRGNTLASGWDGGLPAASTPAGSGAASVLRTTLPNEVPASPAGPGTVVQSADIAPRYAAVPGTLRTSLPDAVQPVAAGTGERQEMTPAGATSATLPQGEAVSLAPQRTSIPGHSAIRPTTDSAAAQLARGDVTYVQPMLVFRPHETQIAALGNDADPRVTTPRGGSSPLAVHPAMPATPAALAVATPNVGSRAATAARPPTRLALLPRTSDERVTLPAMQPSGAPLATTLTTTASLKALKVLFDSQEVAMRAKPELCQGVPMTALREIFEKTDGVLYWYPVSKTVRAVNDKTDIRLQIGKKQATVNQQSRTLGIAPYLKCGRTMVPLQFIADTLDVTVKYEPRTGQIIITSNKL